MNVLTSPWDYRLIRWSLSIVFLYAGATKLADPKAFAALIDEIVPPGDRIEPHRVQVRSFKLI